MEFEDDSVVDGVLGLKRQAESEETQEEERSSPILIPPSFGPKYNYTAAARRRNKLRRSGSGVTPGYLPVVHSFENPKFPPISASDTLTVSQEVQSDFLAPKTPVLKFNHPTSPQCGAESDDDIFANSFTAPSNEEMPSALNTLLGGPDHVDISWTSSMATPLTSNVKSNLNTEERKVLLPSEDCSFAVKPRALFSPDLNDSTDCQLLNNSSDSEYIQACRGEKTPKFIRRKLSRIRTMSVESPLAARSKSIPLNSCDTSDVDKPCKEDDLSSINLRGAGISNDPSCDSPNQKFSGACDQALRDSPILSGNSDFAMSPNGGDEDLFGCSQEYYNELVPSSQTSSNKDCSIAGSTPKTESRKKSPSSENSHTSTPHPNNDNTESFLQDISFSALEEICQAQERTNSSSEPTNSEKQTDSKRKRLFLSPSNVKADIISLDVFKAPERNTNEIKSITEENHQNICIPDDSFMEHLAGMNTTIFSDTMQPVSRVQSIKSSSSCVKKFSYSLDQTSDGNAMDTSLLNDPQKLMKEILGSVMALESANGVITKSKTVKSSSEFVAFSKLQEENDLHDDHLAKAPLGIQEDEILSLATSNIGNLSKRSDEKQVLSINDSFQTASGNRIEISQEAIRKGLDLLKDALEVGERPSDGFGNSVNSMFSDATKATSCAALVVPFQTNSMLSAPSKALEVKQNEGKLVDLSNDQMLQAEEEVKQLMQLVNDGEDFNPWHEIEQPQCTQHESKSEIPLDNKPGHSQHIVMEDLQSTRGTISSIKNISSGFTTASGKTAFVSEEKLAKAKKILCDAENESSHLLLEGSKLVIKSSLKDSHDEKSLADYKIISPEKVSKSTRLNVPKLTVESDIVAINSSPRKDESAGGSIKSCKRKIEEVSLADKMQDTVQAVDENNAVLSNKKTCIESFLSVRDPGDKCLEEGVSASIWNDLAVKGITMNLSEHAMDIVNGLIGNNRSRLVHSEDKPLSAESKQPVGFSTASGRTVVVSKQALLKVQNLFDDLSTDSAGYSERKPNQVANNDVSSVYAADNQFVSPCSQSEKIEESDLAYFNEQRSQTALKLKAQVSNTCCRSELTDTGEKSVDVLKEAVNKVENLSVDLSEISKNSEAKQDLLEFLAEDKMSNEGSSMIGFSTASGKSVRVSQKALRKAKSLFNDLPQEAASEQKVNTSLPLSKDKSVAHFRSNSAAGVSEAKFQRTDHTLLSDHSKVNCETFCGGFSTATGKSVSVSKQALENAKRLLADISVESTHNGISKPTLSSEGASNVSLTANDCSKTMVGFSTARGNAVNVSKQALKKVQHLFDDLPATEDTAQTCGINTLQNGSSTHHDVHDLGQGMSFMKGFSTASGKTVSIPEEALEKVKGLFGIDGCLPESAPDLSLSNIIEPAIIVSPEPVKMAGFSTASGKTVNVSKDALSKAKNIFGDLQFQPTDDIDENDLSVYLKTNNSTVMTDSATQDDSGVFMSRDNTQNKVSPGKISHHCFQVPLPKSMVLPCTSGANKENLSGGLESSTRKPDLDFQRPSLTQEISASTAALIADEESFSETESLSTAENNLKTISTSPSMLTDRISNFKPILSSASEEHIKTVEPTSPILAKNDNVGLRRRLRRGRLSLSTIGASRSITSNLGTPPVTSSQKIHAKSSTSVPAKSSSSIISPLLSVPLSCDEKIRSSVSPCGDISSITGVKNEPKLSVKLGLSRKLFNNEVLLSPAKQEGTNKNDVVSSPLKVDISSPLPISHSKDNYVSKNSNTTPLMKKTLTRNLGGQSSGFKTPYKTSITENQKRCSTSPAKNPPQAKQRKTSDNLYVSHINIFTSDPLHTDSRQLRPEVAEMRRRAAKEQKQLVDTYTEVKGELLRPRIGSWLMRKMSREQPHLKLIEMMKIEHLHTYPPVKLMRMGLKKSTVHVTAANSEEFRFSLWDYYSGDICRENVAGIPVGDGALLVLDNDGSAGVEEFERAFLASPGVDPSLVAEGWIRNHYRWLIWKLAAMECRFPHQFGGCCLTPHLLMLQLKYRYDREIDRCERPALRRILELDDSAAKRMVLCVASIRIQKDSNNSSSSIDLELTDGWYSVAASIDQDMQRRVTKGVIVVGTKLIMHGAELMNCPEGCSPLQARPEVRLKICSNSSRRARWYAKLGFQDNPGPIQISLESILSAGGVVSCVSAYVARIYPVVYMEKKEDRTVVRSQRAESKEVAECEKKRQQLAEVVYSQVQAEFQLEQKKPRRSAIKFSQRHLSTLMSGEELTEILENSSDPLSVQNMLSEEQKSIISEYQRYKQEEVCRDLETRVRLKLSENPNSERQVTPILKIRLLSCHNSQKNSTAILSIWRPSEDMVSIFKEGSKVTIFGAVANGSRCGDLQLSSNRSTRYHSDYSSVNSDILRCVSTLSSLSSPSISFRFGELDIVGLVIRISPAPQTSENSSHYQTIYLCDSEQNFIAVLLWGGMKDLGIEDLITQHSFIAVSNLQWRGAPLVRAIPCVYASELSFFTTNPRQSYLQTALQKLRHSLTADLKTYCRECEEKLENVLSSKTSLPDAYERTPDEAIKSKEGVTLVLNKPTENGSSCQSTPNLKVHHRLMVDLESKTPSSANIRSPIIQKNLAKLEGYRDAPPVPPICIPQPKRSLRTEFRAPRQTDSPSTEKRK